MENDEVVGTMPVFLSQDLANSLYLLQYPLRPLDRPYSNDLGQLSSVKVKPNQKKIEVEYALNTNNRNYDSEGNIIETTQPAIKKFKFSSKLVPPKTNYAVGVVREGQLHLTPIHAVCRMLPDLDYINQAMQQDAEPQQPEETKIEVTPLLVRFQKKENERSAAYQKVTHAYMKQLQDQEPFIDLKMAPPKSVGLLSTYEKLISPSSVPVNFNVAASDYFSHINPPAPGTAEIKLETIVDERCLSLLKRARVAPFRTVCSLMRSSSLRSSSFSSFPSSSSSSSSSSSGSSAKSSIPKLTAELIPQLLAVCSKYAWLVQGNWVCKSQFVAAGRAAAARDLLITRFSESHAVGVDVLVGLLDPPDALQVYEELGIRVGEEWRLKQPRDEQFILSFPAVVEQQAKTLRELALSIDKSLHAEPAVAKS